MNREPLRVITSGALAAALEKLLAAYSEKNGCEIDLSFGSSLGEARDSIPTRLSKGEEFDLFFLAESALEAFAAQGHILAESRIDLVESHIGAAVRIADETPDIGTVEAFRRALLNAKSVAHAASASGIYLSTVVFPALGIAEQMKRTARTIYSERVGSVVARGEADIGFQQISEILPIEGVKMIGRLPAEIRRPFVFSAGIGAKSEKRSEAKDLMRFLVSGAAGPTIRETGLDPLHADVK